MYRMHCVLAFVTMYVALAHSFSWDIVTADYELHFYDIDGTLTHTENVTSPWGGLNHITYDPVHHKVLFADYQNIYSFDTATMKTEHLITIKNIVSDLAYDPATQSVIWVEDYQYMYSISLKPGFNKNKDNEKHLILSQEDLIRDIVVDSCGGFIYWKTNERNAIHRARFNGTEIEMVMYLTHRCILNSVTIDQQSQKLYFSDSCDTDDVRVRMVSLQTADLNGKNRTTLVSSTQNMALLFNMAVSKDFIYGAMSTFGFSQMPKNPPRATEVSKSIKFFQHTDHIYGMATRYDIEDMTRELQNCDALTKLLSNNSVSTDVSLLCVHGTKVSGEYRCECAQGYSGERCDVSVCHNYCLHGDCSASAEGLPKCRCNAGYSGERCEENACQAYCLNDGVCSLSEDSKPVCQCTGGHGGDRCEVPVFLTKCVQTVTMLRDLLNTDVTSDIGVKSTPSTVV